MRKTNMDQIRRIKMAAQKPFNKDADVGDVFLNLIDDMKLRGDV